MPKTPAQLSGYNLTINHLHAIGNITALDYSAQTEVINSAG